MNVLALQTLLTILALAPGAGATHSPGQGSCLEDEPALPNGWMHTRAEGARIRFEPASPVVLGDRVSWRIDELVAGAEYRVTADLTDEWGDPWRATATFVSDSEGVIDPALVAPIAGDYEGVDPLGLFWSGARTQPPDGSSTRPAASSSFALTLRSDDELVARAELERWLISPDVEVRPFEAEGTVADLYVPKDATNAPAVVLLGGSGGGLRWQRLLAGILASNGYPSLALAYFNAPGLPDRLDRIPVETVLDALLALGANPSVDPDRIAVIGYSKGAELALLAGAMFEEVRAVIAYAPSSVVFQAFLPPKFPSLSSWTLDGEEYPFVPLRGYRPTASSVENWMTYLGNEKAVAEASIPVEFIQGAVLLLSGREDTIWPSSYMADAVMERLRASDFDRTFTHMAFPEAGHGIARPGFLPTGPTAERNGGTPAGNSRAQIEGWQAVLGFLEANL